MVFIERAEAHTRIHSFFRMRRYCLAEIALYAVLVLVARETRSEQGESRSAKVAKQLLGV